jgi:hypothetical protein
MMLAAWSKGMLSSPPVLTAFILVVLRCAVLVSGQDDVPGLQVKMASDKWVIAPTIPGDEQAIWKPDVG